MREGLQRVCQAGLNGLMFGLLLAAPAAAQFDKLIARDGWEAFTGAQYKGGDATQPKERQGVLVLTDTTLALYRCRAEGCMDRPPKLPWEGEPHLLVDLRRVTAVSSSVSARNANAGEKLMLGVLAGGGKEGMVGVTYETGSSVEVPTFKVGAALAEALEAKIRFRLKKLGVALPERTP